MLEYWDRVEDRLFKLRHCMDLNGVKRAPALFAPPIDPALLVAAGASGLSLEDILAGLDSPVPAYRFTYLLEKARSFAGTVQSFGGALLSALEKKDSEALALLNSTQNQNILKLTMDVKKKAIDEAKANLQASVEGMTNVMNRILQYAAWIEENLNAWERTQQVSLHTSTIIKGTQGILHTLSAVFGLLPDVGSPFAMKYGGSNLSKNMEGLAYTIKVIGEIASLVSTSAGLEASFQRRKQDWEFQKKTAEQELKQAQQQIIAATVRLAISGKDLEIHEKQIEQAEEVHQFYKDKFTGLGLYNHLATTISRLHRQAYGIAVDMANHAEAAYRFETEDVGFLNQLGNWDASRAGLLSGESLLLRLQKMEVAYMEANRRTNEITQSISLREVAPEALLDLRQNGKCDFEVPEWALDRYYQGYYKRILKSVRLTIPCVVGPYANVACRMNLNSSKVRIAPNDATDSLVQGMSVVPSGYATSTASNDGAQFELNFRDERYLPFEGAGAVSEWSLQLPEQHRSFDYNSISDVILHLSYTAKYDETITSIAASNTRVDDAVKTVLISVKDEFPDAWYQLESGGSPSIAINEKHLPYFMKGESPSKIKIANTTEPDINVGALPISLSLSNTMKSAGENNIWLIVCF